MGKSNQKRQNQFDELVEKLVNEFSKIKNFELTHSDPVGKEVFNIVAFRIADISTFKELVIRSFIPAVNKSIFDAKKEFQASQYKHILKDDLLFKETRYETIRLAYVGLFHKIESLVNDVLKAAEIVFYEGKTSNESIEVFAKRKFNFRFKDWQLIYVTHKINWICNCVKHYDGFPLKEPKPRFFDTLPETRRLQLTAEEFKLDCESFLNFAPVYLQLMYLIGSFQREVENFDNEDVRGDPESLQRQVQYEEKLFNLVDGILSKLKNLGK